MDAIVPDTDATLHDAVHDSRAAALRFDLRALLAGCDGIGLAPAELCARAAVPALHPRNAAAQDVDGLQAAIVRLWQVVLEVRPDPLTPFWIGTAVPFGLYPLFDHLGSSSSTVASALAQLARCYRLVSPKLQLHLEAPELRLEPKLGAAEHRRVYCAYATGLILSRLQAATGEKLAPLRAELVSLPGTCDDQRLTTWLGASCSYGHPVARLVLRPETWQKSMLQHKPELAALLSSYASDLLERRRGEDDPVQPIRRVIRHEHETTGHVTIEGVAQRLGMTERTLQRRLADSGVTFRELLGEQRREWAMQLLAERKLAVGEVAYRLGYSEQTAFARAFRRWTGVSPVDYRRQSA
ncbi:MAG: helix-turn-helix domain-containing protein [Polyangiales bacterium]